MTKNDMLADPAVVLTSKNPSLSQPKPLEILMDAIRRQGSSAAPLTSTTGTPNQKKQSRSNNRSSRNNRRRQQNSQHKIQQQQKQQQQSLNVSASPNLVSVSNFSQSNNRSRNYQNSSNVNFSNVRSNRRGMNLPRRRVQDMSMPFWGSPYHMPSSIQGPSFHQKLGTSNEYVSREINEYYNRNRQSNENFQSKQIIRAGLERTLQEAFPSYALNLYLVGSSTNGIGDTPNSADICIIVRKRQSKPLLPGDGEDSTNGSEKSNAVSSSIGREEELAPSDGEQNFVLLDGIKEDSEKIALSIVDDQAERSVTSETEVTSESHPKTQNDIVDAEAQPQVDKRNESFDGDYESHYSEVTSDISLSDIEKVLQNKGFAQNVQLIPAKVPVLKFRDSITNLNVTLNLNQEVSIRNSQLIRDYCKMDWRFAPLAMIFKRWAQENRICNAADQTISSYSWTLMTVHYLQVCEPPVLPCLQKMNPRRYEQHRGDILKAIKFWRRQPARPWQSQNNRNLRQLLKGMFRYYGYTYNYNQHVISVREGRLLDRSRFSRRTLVEGKTEQWIPNYWTSFLAIEEPFTKTNTSCSVHDKEKFSRIVDLFRLSSGSLRGIRISLYNIIADDLFFPITY